MDQLQFPPVPISKPESTSNPDGSKPSQHNPWIMNLEQRHCVSFTVTTDKVVSAAKYHSSPFPFIQVKEIPSSTATAKCSCLQCSGPLHCGQPPPERASAENQNVVFDPGYGGQMYMCVADSMAMHASGQPSDGGQSYANHGPSYPTLQATDPLLPSSTNSNHSSFTGPLHVAPTLPTGPSTDNRQYWQQTGYLQWVGPLQDQAYGRSCRREEYEVENWNRMYQTMVPLLAHTQGCWVEDVGEGGSS
ncbi:hypothetical protein D9613_011645 [Agrocybe pediades]|uniref:Uncharacterized protein n=1 Tax=Agrocybe pediades TaxID=84607 RepID=A0A8H4QVK0_9AGAR|nr:hypothetical protein D9613_011645 [Agrocybe pediades]